MFYTYFCNSELYSTVYFAWDGNVCLKSLIFAKFSEVPVFFAVDLGDLSLEFLHDTHVE